MFLTAFNGRSWTALSTKQRAGLRRKAGAALRPNAPPPRTPSGRARAEWVGIRPAVGGRPIDRAPVPVAANFPPCRPDGTGPRARDDFSTPPAPGTGRD